MAHLPPPNALEARVFPPALTLALFIGNFLISRRRNTPLDSFRTDLGDTGRFLAAAVTATGLGIGAAAVLRFGAKSTTITPFEPEKASSLVTDGIFAYTRNPMYLAMALLISAPSLWFGQPAGLAIVVAFVGWITRFQIVPEERALYKLFGDAYVRYVASVRRWI